MPCNNASLFLLAIILTFITLSLQLSQQFLENAQSVQQMPFFTIELIYQTQIFSKQLVLPNSTIINSTTIYNNSIVNAFMPVQNSLSCSNLQLFTLKQQIWEHQNGTSFSIVLNNYQQQLNVQVSTYYSSPPVTQNTTTCEYSAQSGNICVVGVISQCQANPKQANIVIGRVYNANNGLITQFWFNYICDYDMYYNSPLSHIAWGALAIVVFSIFMIFVSARFQQAKSFGNPTFYINYPVIITLNLIDTLKYILICKDVPYTEQIINYTCVVLSFVIGVPCIMICWCQFFYCFRKRWVKFACYKGKFNLRIMDIIGLLVGAGAFTGWLFSNSNSVVSDIIFVFIYFALIKIIKFGSLKIALITLACSLVLSIVFVVLYTQMQIIVQLNFFSNPLFLMAPIWTRIPNQRCSWYFLVSMLYPGMLLAYLHRFDINRSSLIYCPTFLICYGIFSIVWFVVGSSVNVPLPYDVFTVPISMVLLVLFANRRGELQDLWVGRFYDAQKNYYQNQQQMMANLTVQKSKSNYTYDKSLFQNLKYGEYSESSRSSKDSRFSQIIKESTNMNMKKQNEMKYMYSQGQEKKKKKVPQPQAAIKSDETERVSYLPVSSAVESNRWTLSDIQHERHKILHAFSPIANPVPIISKTGDQNSGQHYSIINSSTGEI